jgi:ATP-binding cassette subfamily C protein LapB
VAVASIGLNILGLALPLALLQIYDRIIPNNSRGTLLLLIGGVVVAVLLEALLRIARGEIVSWLGIQFEHRAGCDAFARMMGAPVDELERTGAGELIERLSGLPLVREVFSEHWTLAVCDLPFVLVFLGMIWYLAGWLVLAPAGVLMLFVVTAGLGARAVERSIANFNTVRDRRQNFNIEVIQGVHAVKSMAMEGQMIQRYARLQEAVAGASHNMVLGNSKALSAGAAFAQLVTLSVVVFGGLQVVDNVLTVGGLSACTLLAGRALQPVQKAVGLWTRYQTARLMRRRFESVFALTQDVEQAQPIRREIVGGIELSGVKFGYNDAGDDLFSGIDLRVQPGERIAITGDNGCGKSTLLRVIFGTVAPTAGEVRIDGDLVEEYDPVPLRSQAMAFVPQRGELFRGTITENLTMFRPGLRKEALRIARALGLDEVVYRLPQGYETLVADGSSEMLPRGVTQRIAVVRALAVRPRILLFDEANATMDGHGDEQLRHYLETLDRGTTLVLVTLRPSLQRLADRVLNLKDGKLVAGKAPGAQAPAPATAPVVNATVLAAGVAE